MKLFQIWEINEIPTYLLENGNSSYLIQDGNKKKTTPARIERSSLYCQSDSCDKTHHVRYPCKEGSGYLAVPARITSSGRGWLIFEISTRTMQFPVQLLKSTLMLGFLFKI